MNNILKDPIADFEKERRDSISKYRSDTNWHELSFHWLHRAFEQRYMYNFDWLGRPIIQTPIDMIAIQEIIWEVKPDLIIETGIAHGGSLIFSASMLAMLDMYDAIEAGKSLDPKISHRKVLGIDIDIRSHNRSAIEAHPMSQRIEMIQGSSIAPEIVSKVHEIAKNYQRILICLDSNHTHAHVLAELEAYAPLTSKDSYCCVFDTVIEDMPNDLFPNRPWSKGNNPKTAVKEYIRILQQEARTAMDGAPLDFSIDKSIEDKLLITVAPDGFLKRI